MHPGSSKRSRFVAAVAAAISVMAAAGTVSAAEIPSGGDLAEGLAVHVSPKGITFMENQVQYLVPGVVTVGNQQGNLFGCLFATQTWRLKNTVINLEVGKVSLIPEEGRLRLMLDLYVSATARAETGGCLPTIGCNVTVPPSLVTADTTIELNLIPDGTGRFDVDAETEAFAIGLNLADPEFGCALGDVVEFFVDLFLGTIENAVVDLLQDYVRPLIEPAIEDAFNSLNIAGSFDLNGVPLDYDFYPTALEIHPGTIGIVMGGHFSTNEVAACADPDRGSVVTVGDVPDFGGLTPSGSEYSIAASLSDDLLNQLLFSAWRGGLLCMNLDTMDSSMLELIGGSLSTILTEDGPMAVQVTATEPPLATLGGPNGETAMISLANLKIDVMADVQGRMARVVGLKLSPLAGATLSFNAQGQLVPELNFDTADLLAEVDYNELAPDVNDAILALLPTIVDQFLPTLTDAIPPIDLPDLGGIVLESAEFTPDGPQGDFLSAYATLGGQVSAGGCSAIPGGGCGVDAGGLGCSLSGEGTRGTAASFGATPAMMLIGIGALLVRRRRERT